MFDHILVPLDGSSLAECVLPHVVAMAEAFGSRVTLLRVLERNHGNRLTAFVDAWDWHARRAEAQAYLSGVSSRLLEAGLKVESVLLEGRAAEDIIRFAHEQQAKLIVLSSHGRGGLSEWNVSSIVQKIMLRAYVPTVIVRAHQPVASDLTGLRYRRVMVPLDGSQRADWVLPVVDTLARVNGCKVLLAHVVHKPELLCILPPSQEDLELVERLTERNRQEAARYLELVRSRFSVEVEIEARLIISDSIVASLHELVDREEVGLVVLAAHGHSGGTKWPYGNVATSFISYGITPLLIVLDVSPHEAQPALVEVVARERRGH